jgi:hypothetical protein
VALAKNIPNGNETGAGLPFRSTPLASVAGNKIKLFAKKMREAKRLKDRHGYERLLELQNVKRKTAEWDALWRYYYSDET